MAKRPNKHKSDPKKPEPDKESSWWDYLSSKPYLAALATFGIGLGTLLMIPGKKPDEVASLPVPVQKQPDIVSAVDPDSEPDKSESIQHPWERKFSPEEIELSGLSDRHFPRPTMKDFIILNEKSRKLVDTKLGLGGKSLFILGETHINLSCYPPQAMILDACVKSRKKVHLLLEYDKKGFEELMEGAKNKDFKGPKKFYHFQPSYYLALLAQESKIDIGFTELSALLDKDNNMEREEHMAKVIRETFEKKNPDIVIFVCGGNHMLPLREHLKNLNPTLINTVFLPTGVLDRAEKFFPDNVRLLRNVFDTNNVEQLYISEKRFSDMLPPGVAELTKKAMERSSSNGRGR